MTPLPPGYNPAAPAVATTPVPLCPICGHDKNRPLAKGFDFELETCSNEWFFARCADCGCVWLNPRPDERELGVIYPATYYSYNLEDTISPLAVKGKAMLDRMKFSGILGALDDSPKSFLDIGCGDGRYLRMFAEQGLSKDRIFGLELSQAAVDRLTDQGFQAHCGRVEDCDQTPLARKIHERVTVAPCFAL